MQFFQILQKSKKSKARLGVLNTAHGRVLTPAFVPVATKGTLKAIPPRDLKEIGVQIAFVNSFHLSLHPGVEVVEKFGGIHEYSQLKLPLMSDSAGFQVFSLGGEGWHRKKGKEAEEEQKSFLVRIGEEGVRFRSAQNGREILFTPELSIKNQEKIGADIIMAFDECIYYGASYDYTKEATDRTHEWLLRGIKAKKREDQFLYGIVQGGVFRDLRSASAKFVAKQKVDGVAVGGVSVGETKKEMREQVRWAAPYLPAEFPRHLLGIGRLEDIFHFVRLGIDTFDCAEPTRLARHGIVYQKRRGRCVRLDLTKSARLKDKNPIEKQCPCSVCQNFSLSFLHHLFKERELLGYYLATYHNLFFFEQVFREIREKILKDGL